VGRRRSASGGRRRWWLAAAVATALAVATVLLAGGDESDDGSTDSGRAGARPVVSGDASRPPAFKGPGSPIADPQSAEEHAQNTAIRIYETLGDVDDVDTRSLCGLMSADARIQTIRYARLSSNIGQARWTCTTAMNVLLHRSRRSQGLPRVEDAQVVGVTTDGNRATATVRLGERGALTTFPLVRENGEWKLGATPVGAD